MPDANHRTRGNSHLFQLGGGLAMRLDGDHSTVPATAYVYYTGPGTISATAGDSAVSGATLVVDRIVYRTTHAADSTVTVENHAGTQVETYLLKAAGIMSSVPVGVEFGDGLRAKVSAADVDVYLVFRRVD